MNRGQRRLKILGKRNIIETDNCKVFRDAQTGTLYSQHGALGNHVAGDKYRIGAGPVAEQPHHGLIPAFGRVIAFLQQRIIEPDSRRLQGVEVAIAPLAGRGVRKRRVRDHGDPLAAPLQQMVGSGFSAGRGVDVHKGDVAFGQLSHQHDRESLLIQTKDLRVILARTGEDDPIHKIFPDGFDVTKWVARFGGSEQNLISHLHGSLPNPQQHLRKQGVCKHLLL